MKLAIEYCKLARTIYGEGYIPLHRPVFSNEEKENFKKILNVDKDSINEKKTSSSIEESIIEKIR